jgi:hypothetical protein
VGMDTNQERKFMLDRVSARGICGARWLDLYAQERCMHDEHNIVRCEWGQMSKGGADRSKRGVA